MIFPCERISEQMGQLFRCEDFGRYIRIRTPFLYPDGDVIDLFLRDDDRVDTLTDLGETVRWLRNQTPAKKRTKKQSKVIEDVCRTNDIAFFKGQLEVRVSDIGFAESVTRLAQGCVQISDLWFSFRNRAFEPITEEISEFLAENNIEFSSFEKHPGRSGRMWPVDFHTRTSQRGSSLVQVLSTGTSGATNRMSEHVVAMWHDLYHLTTGREGIQFVSLFDDTVDVWKEEDFVILDDLSRVAMWSRPDEFIAMIA